MDSVNAAVKIAREALRKERLTPEGVINLVVVALAGIYLLGSRIIDEVGEYWL